MEITKEGRDQDEKRSFTLKKRNGDKVVYEFRASSESDRSLWLSALEKYTHRKEGEALAAVAASLSGDHVAHNDSSKWHDDELCYGCRSEFGVLKRKHHCRSCMHAFCAQCSSKKMKLGKREGRGGDSAEKEVRVCEDCYNKRVIPAPKPKEKAKAASDHLGTVKSSSLSCPPYMCWPPSQRGRTNMRSINLPLIGGRSFHIVVVVIVMKIFAGGAMELQGRQVRVLLGRDQRAATAGLHDPDVAVRAGRDDHTHPAAHLPGDPGPGHRCVVQL